MKAIVPAAGLGTRFLPATKAVPKEMLLVHDRPAIQYCVEEALAAEADEVIIVNSRYKKAIESHFTPDPGLVDHLRSCGKDAYADAVEHAGTLPVSYVYQDEPLGLGHAVHCAAGKTGGEAFYVLLGDVLVPDHDVLPRMLEVHRAHAGASVIAVFPVEDRDVHRFGIIGGQDLGDGIWKVDRLVEKPALEDAPSNLAIFGRYLLSPLTMQLLAEGKQGAGGEIQLTDAMEGLLATQEMYAVVIDPCSGFDTGTVETWLDANIALALRDSQLGPRIREAIAKRL